MTYRRIIAACFVLVLAVAACALGQETVKLEMKFKAGDLTRYKMIMDGSASFGGIPNAPQASNLAVRAVAVVRQRVKRVLPNGDAEISSIVESARYTYGNKTVELPTKKMPTTVFVMDKSGMVKSVAGAQKYPGMPLSVEKFSALPTGELALGESWSQGLPFPGGNLMMVGSVISLDEKLGNSKVAVIKQDISADLDMEKALAGLGGNQMVPQGVKGKGKLTATGTTFFSQEKGRVVRTEGVMDAQMEATGPMPSSQTPQGGGDVTAYLLMHISFELYLLPA